jgi:hypothetical protein
MVIEFFADYQRYDAAGGYRSNYDNCKDYKLAL